MTGIYLDNNASTSMLPAVWEAMLPFYADNSANPASSHRFGQRARQALESAREKTAALLDAEADEVVFTSGATEANNLAILGCQAATHVLSSPIEHPCVIEPIKQLANRGCEVAFLKVDRTGLVDLGVMRQVLRPQTDLIAVMLANHETGVIQPIREIADALHSTVHLHCDAAAAAGKMPISFRALGAATLTISAHKFHGPKGIGALLIRRGTRLGSLLLGGHQQRGRRPGTEPVALAVGLATALELAMNEARERREKVIRLRRRFVELLRADAAPIVINGPEHGGVPHTLNISFPGCKADILLMNLDLAGVACSTGSACSSGSLLPSPVLKAMGAPDEVLHSAMRFSFSHLLAEADIEEAASRVCFAVKQIRGGVAELALDD